MCIWCFHLAPIASQCHVVSQTQPYILNIRIVELSNSLNNFHFGLLFREDRMKRYEGCFIFAIFSEKGLQELSSIATQRFTLANTLPVPK